MRKIKFRGKNINTQEWIYGGTLLNLDDGKNLYMPAIHTKANADEDDNGNIIRIEDCVIYKIDPETVGLFIGIYDKNGKEVYEGDVVRCWGGECCHGIFESDMILEITDITDLDTMAWLSNADNVDVIGNIYDNPELLPKKSMPDEYNFEVGM